LGFYLKFFETNIKYNFYKILASDTVLDVIDEPSLERWTYVLGYASYLPPEGSRQHPWFSDFIDCLKQHGITPYKSLGNDDKVEVNGNLLYGSFPILILYDCNGVACGIIASQTIDKEHAIVMQIPYNSNIHNIADEIRDDLEKRVNGKSISYDA